MSLALNLIHKSHWAITEEALRTMIEVIDRRGQLNTLEKSRGERPKNSEKATIRSGVAIITVRGPLFKRANLMTEHCGATSYEVLRRDFHQMLVSPEVKSIIFDIDSPGGEATVWLRDYGQVHKTEPSLIRDRQIIRDYLSPKWGKVSMDQVTRRDFVELQGRLKAEGRLSAKSINNILGLAQKMFRDAMQWDYIKVNPAFGVKPIRMAEQDFRFWTFEERDRFLSWAKVNDPELYRIVAIAVCTGLRRGEMEGLLRDCLDLERKQIVVKRSYCHKTKRLNEHTKGKKVRRVPMNALVHSLFKERSLIPPLSQVLPFDYQHIVPVRFQPAQKNAGLSPITFHDLRHTFASHLAMSGVSLFDIKELLGHSDIRTTMRYMHLAPDHLSGVTEVLLSSEAGKVSKNVLKEISIVSER